MIIERSATALEDRWKVEAIFNDLSAWEAALNAAAATSTPRWPAIANFKGKLTRPEAVRDLLELYFSHERKITLVYVYARLRYDEDITDDPHMAAYMRAFALMNDFYEETSWMEPELLALSDAQIAALLEAAELAPFRFYLEKILRRKKYTLSAENEMLMAKVSTALQVSSKAFGTLNDADLKFGTALDGDGKEREITHALYPLYIRDRDKTLRINAFKKYFNCYSSFENTLCNLLEGKVQAHLFNAKARGYSSCLEAALYPTNIDSSVYTSLIEAVNDSITSLHRYVALRKKTLGVKAVHLYDMHVPLTAEGDIKMPYSDAEELIIASSAPLGEEYQRLLRTGLQKERWVDRYENKNKRSGAYSSGCYDTQPYILLNYKEQLRDVFTLAHEAGHSMHTLLTNTHQPYQYSHYPIFLAEVASTFNEELLMQLLLQRTQSRQERILLLNHRVEDIFATLFRQTMFAEFELIIYQLAERQEPLTPKLLRAKYRELNSKYFGPAAIIDDEADIEWARIPHFYYYGFYVFQYATGVSAALALADKVCSGSPEAQSNYLAFLKGGSSRYPIDMLKLAGVEMTTPEPVKSAIAKFDQLVALLEKELSS